MIHPALTIAAVLRTGGAALFCPACGRVVNVYQPATIPALDLLNVERCPRCWKAFLDVVEPKA